MKRTIELDLSLDKVVNIPITNVKQLDNVTMIFSVYYKGMEVNIENQEVRLFSMAQDKKSLYEQIDGITKNGNKIIIECKNVIFERVGKTGIELQLKDNEGALTTFNFCVNVQKSICEGEVKESVNKTGVIDILEKGQDIINVINSLPKSRVIEDMLEDIGGSNYNLMYKNKTNNCAIQFPYNCKCYDEVKKSFLELSTYNFKRIFNTRNIDIQSSNWISNTDNYCEAVYSCDIIHNFNTADFIKIILDDDITVLPIKYYCKTIDNNTIRIYSDTMCNLNLTLKSGTYR